MLSPAEQKRIEDLEAKVRDLAAQVKEFDRAQRQLKSEIDHSVDDKNKAAIRIVETMLANGLQLIQTNVNQIQTDVNSMKGMNERQTALLEEAATERGRRVQREEEMVIRQKEISLRGSSVKVDSEDADVAEKKMETRLRKWKVAGAIIIPLVTALAGLLGAAAGSGH